MYRPLFVTFITWMVIALLLSISLAEEPNNNDYVSEIWGFTDIGISKIKFTWTINNLKFCCQKLGELVKSPIFSGNDGCNWFLDTSPKGANELHSDYVSLFLTAVNCNGSATAKFSIVNAKGEQTSIKEVSYQFDPSEGARGYSKFILQTDLFNPKNDLLPDNTLTIVCEITYTTNRTQSFGKFSQPKRHFQEDLGRLLEDASFTDLILSAGGKEFNVHKAILAAQSPVFRARFEDDAKKGRNSSISVEITDVDPKVLSKLLRYIYTGEALDLENVAPDLLAAAENYGLVRLKTLCENILRRNLSIENAVDFFILGENYRAVDLKREAKHFIVSHKFGITNTTGFKSLILAHPKLAVETFKLIG